jgi:hypothetical protein
MKKKNLLLLTFSAAAIILLVSTANGQDDKSKRPSPPAQAKATIGKTVVTIDYSQPAVKGREIGVELAPYGKVWRTGANEATTFEVSAKVKVEGKKLKAGKYALFTIPGEDKWVIIFNSDHNQWGSSSYSKKRDVMRVSVKPVKATDFAERFVINVESNGQVVLQWGEHQVSFKISEK